MSKITRDSLMTLEAYAKARSDYRARVIELSRVIFDMVSLRFKVRRQCATR